MLTLFEFSQKIKSYVKNENYEEALKYYKEYESDFGKENISKNEYIVADILKCLRKTGKVSKGKEYLRYLSLEIDINNGEIIRNSYGWLLYDELKGYASDDSLIAENHEFLVNDEDGVDEGNEIEIEIGDQLLLQIKDILLIVNPISKFSPFSKLFPAFLKKLKNKQKPNWSFINDLLDAIPVENLSIECDSFEKEIKGRKRNIELASNQETWYANKTKALLKLGLFKECYDLSQKALDKFDKFHYNNDVWLARRIALCKKELGDIDAAINELIIILQKKNEWFIQAELANLYFEKQNYDEALKYCALASNNRGDDEFKVRLFFLFGNLLVLRGEREMAYKHFLLISMINDEQERKTKQILIDALENTKGEYKIDFKNSKDLVKHLKEYWKTLLPAELSAKYPSEKDLKGTIKTIPPGKNFGFIIEDNKQEYHFFTDQLKGELNKFERGRKVIFDSKPAKQDGKKPSALNIRLQE